MKAHEGISIVATSIALAVICGCGGSRSLDRAQLIAKADPICKRGNQKLNESKVDPSNIPSVAPAIAAIDEQVSAELAKLTPPSSMAADWKVIVDEWHKAGEAMARVVGSKASGSTAERRYVSSFLQAQQTRSVMATHDGFVECSRY